MFSTNNRNVSLKKWLSFALGASVVVVALFFGLWKTQVPDALALACEDPDAEGCGGGGGPTIHICSNGEDDDGDGKTDYASNGTGDPGCSALTDSNEHGSAQCDDGLDNDGDLSTDYPADTGCSSLTDTTELTPVRTLTVSIPVQETGYDNYARGTVSVSPGNNSCATGNCSFNYNDGQAVQLTATAQPTDAGGSSHFTGWSGDCSGTNATVSLSMSSNKSCTANFHRHASPYPTSHTWTIRNVGNGSGTATYQTLGVPGTCTLAAGGTCTYTVQDDQYISQIRANPNANVTASYPNAGESCFQDGNVFVQHSRTCTVNFALNANPTCSAEAPQVNVNQTATFNALGGTAPYSWSSTGGSPSSSSGSSQFITSYATAGMKTATVTAGGQGTCTVNVVNPTSSCVDLRSNRSTTVQLNGPSPRSNVALTANATQTFTPSTPGSYSVNPSNIPNYTYVINPCGTTSCSQNLSAGSCVLFDIVYTAAPTTDAYCTATPSTVPRNTSTTFAVFNMTGPYTWTLPGAYYYFSPAITTAPNITAQYTAEGTYNATVTGGGKTASCPVVVGTGTPPPPNPGFTMDFWVNSSQNNTPGSVPAPTTLNAFYGSFARLEWASTQTSPTGCIASGSWSGAKARNTAYSSENQGPLTSPPTPKVYTLRCYGFATVYGGTEPYIEKQITINVATTNKCTINVSSNLASKWSITGPTPVPQATASSTSGGPYIVDPGTYTIVPAAGGGGYTGPTVAPASSQSCAAGASINYALTYTPPPVATLDLKANGADNPPAIVKGTTAALTWTSANIQNGSCTASGGTTGWAGPKTNTGSTTSAAINANMTFTMTCRRSLDGTNIVDSVTVPVREKQCGDGLDNDGDQRVDGDDPGCGGGDDDDDDDDDDDEGNVWAQCADGIDNPDLEDSLADRNDPGCLLNGVYDATDNNEQNTSTVPIITACNDGFDNDGDGTIDAADAGCANGDGTEQSEPDIREI